MLGMLVSYMPLASFLRISTAKAGVGGEALMHAQMGLGAWNCHDYFLRAFTSRRASSSPMTPH